MPRRVQELELRPCLKKMKVLEPPPSLDVSFCDDEALPPGIIFTDVLQKKWRIGKPVGRGSFGRIYLASDDIDKEVTKLNARYVVKIEPHTNGPLFVEVHCLIRTAQVTRVKNWRQQHKQKRLGMPVYISSGSFTDENSGTKYRFLVLPRYDVDLQKIISRSKVLDLKNVLIIAIQILDVLEYIHNQGYTHSDIKSSNLMLGFDGNKINKALVKPAPSYQKDNKQLVLLSRKHRKTKTSKSRTSNYYDDEDFILPDRPSLESPENSQRLASVKKKLRKILSDKDTRTLNRHHAFNLRQLSNYVNYEDLNSSVCSDQSYQKLLDDYGNQTIIISGKIKKTIAESSDLVSSLNEVYREAILSQSNGQIYLLDYGLASKFLDSNGNHKDFSMDARKAHDGTLEYSSRDSHIGAHSRRSDLETLGYNLLDWLTGTLPWKTAKVLQEPDLVHVLKKNYMSDIKSLLKACFKTEFYPQFMERYFQYVTSLDFTQKPDYDYCRSLFRSELLKHNYVLDKELSVNFMDSPMSPINRKLCYSKRFGRKNTPPDFLARNGIKKVYERENVCSFENDLKLELLKQTLNTSRDSIRKPCTSRNFFISDADLVARLKKSLMPHDIFGKKLCPKNLRSNKKNIKRRGVKRHRNSIGKFGKLMGSARQFTWAEILAQNPEHIIRKDRNEKDDDICKYKIPDFPSDNTESQTPLLNKDYLVNLNPTYAMTEVINNLKKKLSGKPVKENEELPPGLEGYTPAMLRVYKLREKRILKEKNDANKKQNCEVVITTRYTRSMANKNKINLGINDNKDKDKTDVPEVTKSPKRSTRKAKAKSSPKDTETLEITKPNTKTSKSTKKTPKKATVSTNRRRLRSSKRKK
nr:uncharacterized protein LOC116775583 isoform X2 [Danaus plexippus plexippus]